MCDLAWQPSVPTWASVLSTTCCLTCASWCGVPEGLWWVGLGNHQEPAHHGGLFATPGHRLTVEEHVWFYGQLKGLSAAAVGPEQECLLQDVGLVPKRFTQTRHLSGEPAWDTSSMGGRVVRSLGKDLDAEVHEDSEGGSC